MTHELEKYYCGDTAWDDFVIVFSETWHNCDFQDELIHKMNGHRDLATVIFGIQGKHCLEWIESHIPALDDATPVECALNPVLVNRLREMLMRM